MPDKSQNVDVTIGKDDEKAKAAAEVEAKADAVELSKLRGEADAAALKVANANAVEIKTLATRFDTIQASLETTPLAGMKVLDDMRADVKGLLATLKDDQHATLEAALTHHKEHNPVKASNRSVGVFLNWYDADLNKLWGWFNK